MAKLKLKVGDWVCRPGDTWHWPFAARISALLGGGVATISAGYTIEKGAVVRQSGNVGVPIDGVRLLLPEELVCLKMGVVPEGMGDET